MGHIRAFIAIEIPGKILDKITGIQNEMKQAPAQISWVKPGNIHLTLKFLGNIDESKIEEIVSAIERASAEILPFDIFIKRLGVFPNFKRPRVIWVGTEQNEILARLAKNIDMNMSQLGFAREKRGFKAHLTLGRVKGVRGLTECLEILDINKEFNGGSFIAKEVLLIKSDLKPTGAVYTPLRRIKLEH
ncbi:RNA 2',3'-cyclic phosphodiesterase [candidate division KSB1 bacterium]|nr:RNA 2',3'-cyclic phosphodiesterase [candidate division KSB1 bacterium]